MDDPRDIASLDRLFNPASVAVIGASREPHKTGHEILASLIRGGFEGKIWPVNPKADEIEGLACYPDLTSIGQAPDLAVIVVPKPLVKGVVEECARVGTKSAIIVTAGFKETSEEGERLEREILRTAQRAGLRLIGPNCLGIMVPKNKLNASFGGDLPEPGVIGYFSQSGSLLASIVDMARAEGIGFSKCVSMGNKADIGELELLRYFGRDDDTRVIAGYLETITDGDAFVREAERISRTKPILLMKAGETGAGREAASSHTGRLAGTQQAFEVVFERAGIIRCESIRRQFDYARALADQPLPAGQRVAVIANAGGPGIMAADALEGEGLTLARLADETQARLRERLPNAANLANPIDVLGDALADVYEFALGQALADANVDAVLAILSPHAMTECDATAEAVVRVAREARGKPIVACFLGAGRVARAVEILHRGRIPQYESPESAVAALRIMAKVNRWRNRPKRIVRLFPVNRRKVEQVINRTLRRGQSEISEMDASDILEAYGFVTPRGQVAASADQAANFADQIGYPVVLKIWSPDILHKTDVDGVKQGLAGRQDVMDAFDLMMYRIPKKRPDADILGVLVQETVAGGSEVYLGMQRDPRFGPLMMFGMGGIMVETLRDVAFHLAPLTAEEAREMLASTRTYQLLRDTEDEGRPAVDLDALAEGLQRLSQLVTEFPQIQEMQITPYVVGPEGTQPIAVDARIRVAEA
ncbi:MAG: acetate--CoA ligase family protein [Planctomycetes bacterium]|nr:acetate--CoA ligase family protein [Planctomycetota bacterium]